MAFYIGADKVISDTDATAGISTNSDLDKLQINGTDVLTHSGGVVTLKNVTFDDASEVTINTDNISEGTYIKKERYIGDYQFSKACKRPT